MPATGESRSYALGLGRVLYLDNLKGVLIAGIIAAHAVLGYAGFIEVWSYTEVREVTLSPVTEMVYFLLVGPFGFLVIPMLFLISGLLTERSLQRKGPGQYVRDRLLHLGVPFFVYILLIQPLVMYAFEHPLGHATGSYWYEMLGSERQLDTGPLWFVGVLLVFSLVYAGWHAAAGRGHDSVRAPSREITVATLALTAVPVIAASFVIRLVYPYGSESGFTDLNLWEWPTCAALFGLGIAASRQGWLLVVPDSLRRRCRTICLTAIVAMAMMLAVMGAFDAIDAALGGWNWLAIAFATIEVTLALFGSVWLLAVAQRQLSRPLRWMGTAVRRSAYGAFILQTPVLIGLAMALRPVPLVAEAKAFMVAAFGVVISFGLAHLLVRHVRWVARIL